MVRLPWQWQVIPVDVRAVVHEHGHVCVGIGELCSTLCDQARAFLALLDLPFVGNEIGPPYNDREVRRLLGREVDRPPFLLETINQYLVFVFWFTVVFLKS